MHIPARAVSTLLFSAAIAAWFPVHAAAQIGMSECKPYDLRADNQQGRRALQPNEPDDTPRPFTTSGNVVITCGDAQLFADEIEYYDDTKVLKARGHVNFIDGNQRISAERLEFNTRTKLGTFYKAQGIMTIAAKPDMTGMFTPADADAYFYGETIEKTGPDTYKFTNGVLTTCVQPTPRWEIVGSKVILVKDKRALLWNAVFKIKNVPVFYLPFMYYPISKDGRGTGFLMPSYGTDTYRGQTFSETFFLVLGRSMDATFNYEFASKAGNSYGGEYRYIQGPGSEGNLQARIFNGKSNAEQALLASRRRDVFGTLTQRLPGNWFLRGNVNYSDNLQARQLTQQDLFLNTSSQRTAGANINGTIAKILVTGEASVTDDFTTSGAVTSARRYGFLPRIRAEWPSTPIGSSKVYFAMAGDFASIVRQNEIGVPETKRGVNRFDTHPTVSMPIGSLPYLGIRAVAGMQFTYWSEQLDLVNPSGPQLKQGLTRRIGDLALIISGPKFSRIFDTPNSGYATRWKHVITPSVTVTRLTGFDEVAKVPKNDGTDSVIGGTTNVEYGITNTLLAKKPSLGGQAVEIASISVRQSYYSNELAGAADQSYQGTPTASPFSAVAIAANVQPTTRFGGSAVLSYDAKFREFREMSAGAGISQGALIARADYSRTFFVDGLAGYSNKDAVRQAIITSGAYRALDNRLNTRFSWSYDFKNKHQVNRQLFISYMSQCCGVAVDYTSFFVPLSSTVKQNRIIKLSFSLGGIGTFAPPSGLFK